MACQNRVRERGKFGCNCFRGPPTRSPPTRPVDLTGYGPGWGRDDPCLHDSAAVQSECANLEKSIFRTPAIFSCIFFYSIPSVRKAENIGRLSGRNVRF
jgi:hypothetical protein